MKLKLEQLVNSAPALSNIFAEKIPIGLSFQLKRVIKEVEDHLKDFNDSRKQLFETLGEETEDGYKINPENMDKFNEQLQELLDTEIEVPFKPIKASSLGNVAVAPRDLFALDWFILEE